jgi:hypothetical protein
MDQSDHQTSEEEEAREKELKRINTLKVKTKFKTEKIASLCVKSPLMDQDKLPDFVICQINKNNRQKFAKK